MNHISRDKALELLTKYNKDLFHIQHAFTVEAVMKWYANELGYGEDGVPLSQCVLSVSLCNPP